MLRPAKSSISLSRYFKPRAVRCALHPRLQRERISPTDKCVFVCLDAAPGCALLFSMHFERFRFSPGQNGFRASPADSKKTILLVEDDTAVLQILRDVLRRLGHRVFTAKDVSEAEEVWAAARAEIDIVVCDQLLGLDRGSDLVQRFKTHRPDVKMVLCSGATTSLEIPGISFLAKPFKVSALLDAAV